MALSTHAKGYLITVSGVMVMTPDTLLIRLARIDPFTLAATRGLLGGIVVLGLCLLWYRGALVAQFWGLGLWALGAALLQSLGLVMFVVALEYTSAANVLIFFATTPLLAAVMAWGVLGERVGPVTWAAIAVVLAGIVVIASGSLGSVHLFGDFLALLDAIAIAGFYVIIRRHKDVDLVPAMGLGLLFAAVLTLPFFDFSDIRPIQWLWIALGGGIVVPLALILLTLGPRYLAAPEVAMLGLLETVIGPFWVWLVLREEPGIRSLIGGAIIVAALLIHAIVRLRSVRRSLRA